MQQTKLKESFGVILQPESIADPLDLDIKEIGDLFRSYRTIYFKEWNFTLESFQEFSQKLCNKFSSYEGGGFRFKALDREFVSADKTVMTTTGHTQGFSIPLHGEMHYMGTPPPVIWFYCSTPGNNTGQTTLCDGYELACNLSKNVKDYFRNRKIRYNRFLEDGAWQSSFLTDDPGIAMDLCRQQKVSFQYDRGRNEFTTEYVVDPLPWSDDAGGPRFINNMLNIASVEWAFESGWVKKTFASDLGGRCPMIVRMEDGSRIPSEILDEIKATAEAITINVEWNAGEVVMVDNLSVMHGRRESLNPERKVFVRMGNTNF